MIKKKTFLCVIAARGGSKGIPDKNIIELNNNPLIYYVIKAAKESDIFDRIIVSTDSEKIAIVSKECGAEVPFLRPDYLASDDSIVEDTIVHALKHIEQHDKKYDYICFLQPTSPLIRFTDIKKAIDLLFDKKSDMIVSVGESPINIKWARYLSNNGSMKNFSSEVCGTNRQCFENAYYLNGAIYLGKWDIFYNKKNYYKQNTYAYVMPYSRSIDIDNYFDLKLVEFIMREYDE